MPTAATVTVTIIRASMSIALVLISMHLAAVLSSIRRRFVKWNSILSTVEVIVLIITIIDQRCQGPRTEAIFNQSMAL